MYSRGALLRLIAVTSSGTSRLGSSEVYRLPGPRMIRSAWAIASIARGRAGGRSGMQPSRTIGLVALPIADSPSMRSPFSSSAHRRTSAVVAGTT